MDIRDALTAMGGANGSFTFEYQSVTNPDTGVKETISIDYAKDSAGLYFGVLSTRYTQEVNDYVLKVGDNMSGELINSTRFEGGFAIETRPVIGD